MSQLALYTPCEYLRYGSTVIIHFFSAGIDYLNQILIPALKELEHHITHWNFCLATATHNYNCIGENYSSLFDLRQDICKS